MLSGLSGEEKGIVTMFIIVIHIILSLICFGGMDFSE